MVKLFFLQKKIWVEIFLAGKIIEAAKKFGSKKIDPKKFGFKKCWLKKNEIVFGRNKMWLKYFCLKKYLGQKKFIKKKLGQKNVGKSFFA